jgi:TPR repeat protein
MTKSPRNFMLTRLGTLNILGASIALCFNLAAPLNVLADVEALTPQQLVTKAEQAFDQSDIVNAMRYYRQAAESGYAPAQTRLAYLLDKSEENQDAVHWYRRAAAQGDAQAMHDLANLYAIGEGTEVNIDKALKLFTSSAQQNYHPAIRVLALAYENGQLGLRVDYEQARAWLETGMKLGDYWSTHRLAKMYRNGELGVRVNNLKASELEQLLPTLNTSTEQP